MVDCHPGCARLRISRRRTDLACPRWAGRGLIPGPRLVRRFWLIPLVVMVLSACSDECGQQTAVELGRQQALADQALTANATPDGQACALRWPEEWQQGWNRGRDQLCQPEQGWLMGRGGNGAYQVCGGQTNRPDTYLAAYRLGRQLNELEQEAAALEALEHNGVVLTPAQAARRRALHHEINALQSLAQQQGFLDATPPPSAGGDGQ